MEYVFLRGITMKKKKKVSGHTLSYGTFFSLCREFADFQIDENFESMKYQAEIIRDYPLDEATKKCALEKNGLSDYDIEEAIFRSACHTEGGEDNRLAVALEKFEEFQDYYYPQDIPTLGDIAEEEYFAIAEAADGTAGIDDIEIIDDAGIVLSDN